MNKIIFKIIKKKYPYKEPHDPNIYWAEIALTVVSDQSQVLKEVFRLQWDARVFLDWLISNKKNILNEELPIRINDNYSIAEKIYLFYDMKKEIDEEILNKMFEYRQSHGIRFGLRGTNVVEVYLGKNNSAYEISFYEKNKFWKYEFDPISFYENVESCLNEILE